MKYFSRPSSKASRAAPISLRPHGLLKTGLAVGVSAIWGASPALAALNDTGQITCVKGTRFVTSCAGTGQDAEHGRDVDVPRSKDGWSGFQFVKVCNSGSVAGKGGCLASAAQGAGPNDWGCTQDKVTGLMWEMKTTDGGLHDRNRQFNDSLGHPASVDVQVAAVNAAGLCGRQDWRRPTVDELFGLADFHEYPDGSFPGIETQWFPDLPGAGTPVFWSAIPWVMPRSAPATWAVRYGGGQPSPLHTSVFEFNHLRLVVPAR